MSLYKLQNKTFDINAKHRYLNFTAYYFDRKQFNSLVEKYFKSDKNPFRYIKYQYERNYNPHQDQLDIHIQGLLILKDATRIGNYLKAGEKNRKKDSISGVKGLLEMNKTHFEGIASIEDSVLYTGKDYNKCSLHHKKPINPNDPKSKIILDGDELDNGELDDELDDYEPNDEIDDELEDFEPDYYDENIIDFLNLFSSKNTSELKMMKIKYLEHEHRGIEVKSDID
ncbi:15711_t:CDS:2 [Dentiscutata heterogama]|uniref:15711_t:CDS:1 n=1 Tax=Dentiscutata heterogama TaxID=1316150 RepID=A0ACA9KWG4_9GLOM|nr:15711_t:CDS:2 [Dentiscutata heterogama]